MRKSKHVIILASTQKLYQGIAKGNIIADFTAPAFNLRTLTLDAARALFRAAAKLKASAFIIELARSEMEYTSQPPQEYASNILKAAQVENWTGPIFLQADHFKIKKENFTTAHQKEITDLESLIKEALAAGFYNIDIDCSAFPLAENIEYTAYFLNFIRQNQPNDIVISVGGEVGEIGRENTSPEQLRKFLDGLKKETTRLGHKDGIVKVAVQTGTSHGQGGVIDWENLKALSSESKNQGLAGIVQHGASTLPDADFAKFPRAGVLEIHLSTEFQNIILESPHFPADLRAKIQTKTDLGKYENEILSLPQKNKDKICQELEKKFTFFLKTLGVGDTKDLIQNIYNSE